MRGLGMMGITPVVKALIIANVAVFVLQVVLPMRLSLIFGLAPARFWDGYLWQPVTYMFLHGGPMHLLFNMFVLWMFGSPLEQTWGRNEFIKYYFVCGVGAGLLNAALTPGSPIPIVGASGAIYGLLLAYGILFPERLIYIWGIIPIRAKYFVLIMGGIELFASLDSANSNIAHFAHLGGMLFGLVYLKREKWTRDLKGRRTSAKRSGHLRVVKDRDQEKEKLQRAVDTLLSKVNQDGINSLTEEEAEFLKKVIARLEEINRGG